MVFCKYLVEMSINNGIIFFIRNYFSVWKCRLMELKINIIWTTFKIHDLTGVRKVFCRQVSMLPGSINPGRSFASTPVFLINK